MKSIVLIAHNLRSAHNVGSLLRTAEGLGVDKVYLSGYTPYPVIANDPRLPHLSRQINERIHKTALGAENMISLAVFQEIGPLISHLKNKGYSLVALEQNDNSIDLKKFVAPNKTALIVGREVEGLEAEVLELCEFIVEIPMRGKKESFNVVQAAAMALYSIML